MLRDSVQAPLEFRVAAWSGRAELPEFQVSTTIIRRVSKPASHC